MNRHHAAACSQVRLSCHRLFRSHRNGALLGFHKRRLHIRQLSVKTLAARPFFLCFLAIGSHTPFSIKAVKMLRGHVLLVVDRQQAFYVLFLRHADVEAAVPDALFQLFQGAVVLVGLGVDPVDESELPRRGGGGLDIVQVGHVLPEHFPDSGDRLLLQPGLIVVLVVLEGLAGVQGQKLRRVDAPKEVRQSPHPVSDAVGGEDGEIIRAEKEKDQLTLGRLQAVFGELVNAHELPGGQTPPQLLFLFSVQNQDSSHV